MAWLNLFSGLIAVNSRRSPFVMSKIASFVYHDVTDDPTDSGFQRASALPYKHPKKEFLANLDIIKSANAPVITVNELDAVGEKAILLTFDDGGKSFMYIAEQLDKYNLKGHFFITTDLIGDRLFVNRQNIVELHKNGHIIGSHSHTHPNIFYRLSYEAMLEEWKISKSVLEGIISDKVVCCSIPGGDADGNSYISAAECGYSYLFDSEITMNLRYEKNITIIGRVCPKQGTDMKVVQDYVNFKGFTKARNIRGIKKIAKKILYPIYLAKRKGSLYES